MDDRHRPHDEIILSARWFDSQKKREAAVC